MEEYSYNCTHPLGHTGPVTGKLYIYLYLYPLRVDAVWAHSRYGRFGEANSLPLVCNRIAIFFTARSLVTADVAGQYGDE